MPLQSSAMYIQERVHLVYIGSQKVGVLCDSVVERCKERKVRTERETGVFIRTCEPQDSWQ